MKPHDADLRVVTLIPYLEMQIFINQDANLRVEFEKIQMLTLSLSSNQDVPMFLLCNDFRIWKYKITVLHGSESLFIISWSVDVPFVLSTTGATVDCGQLEEGTAY